MKEYTIVSSLAVAIVVALDFFLKTRLVRQRGFWLFLGIMGLGMLVVNGYLTARPIVLYGESMNTGVRIFTIPIEDLLFGFSAVTLCIIFWEYCLQREQVRRHGRARAAHTTYSLHRSQVLPFPRPEVFSFFSAPENLARITPRWLAFHIVTPSPVRVSAGSTMDYTIRWFGLLIKWRTLIAQYDPPRRFIDEQLRGPFTLWHHSHTFVDHGEETEMIDEILYCLPMGLAGRLMHHLVVRRQLNEIFDTRAAVIEQLLEASIVPVSGVKSSRGSV